MNARRAVSGLGLLLAAALCSSPSARGTTDPLVAEAVSTESYVLGEFVSASCPACEQMRPVVDAVLARHPDLGHQVHDADREPDLARKYDVRCVPVFVVVAPDGQVRFNDVGMWTESELERILLEAGVGVR